MNKFGPHFQRYTSEMRELIARWQPPVVVWVDPNRYGVEEIRSLSPGTFIIGRKSEEGGWNSPNLKDRAYYWANECAKMGPCDAYVAWNEPISHDDKDNFGRLDDFHMWFRERILTHGIEAVGLNVGTGNFTKLDDIAECFPQTCATYRHIGIHEYDWIMDPSRRPADADRLGYYWGRWAYWLGDIGRDDVALWLTECGMTQAVHEGRPDEGWRSGADGMTDDDYIAWAGWYNRQLAKDSRVKGAALFNFAGYGWETFEHLGWERLDEILALDAPGPENGGNGMDIKVYDRNGVEKNLDWASQEYGFGYRQADAQPGQKVFRLVEVREKTGPSTHIAAVMDEDGSPLAGARVAFYWPDAPAIEDLSVHDWYEKAQVGTVNENGEVGNGMGGGAYVGRGQCGPHAVWVHHASIASDLHECIGMVAGTPHDHLDTKFQLMIVKDDGNGNGNGNGGQADELRVAVEFEIGERLAEVLAKFASGE